MKKDGGTAFPSLEVFTTEFIEENEKAETTRYSTGGMTLRDYFAAAALQGMVQRGGDHGAYVAESAYRFADAMLEERNKDNA